MSDNESSSITNKKYWVSFVVALGLSMLVYLIYPVWQVVVLIGFLSGFIAGDAKVGFVSSFSGVFIGWLLLLWTQSLTYPITEASKLLAEIMGMSASLWSYIALLSLTVGGIAAGLGGLAGAYTIKSMIKSE